MKRQLLFYFILLGIRFSGFSQENINRYDYEIKYLFQFISKMNDSIITYQRSDFSTALHIIGRLKPICIPIDYKYIIENKKVIDESMTHNYETYMFRNYVLTENQEEVLDVSYALWLEIRNDSIIGFSFHYPPVEKTVSLDTLKVFVNIAKNEENFYKLQNFGNEAFRVGYKMPNNYKRILKEFLIKDEGWYNTDEVDRFRFYYSKGERTEYRVELYVNKKSKKIRNFDAIGFW